MDARPVGVFDSGLGGLSAVRCLLSLLPFEDVVYFGDTGRVPYGTRGTTVIEKYAAQDAAFLLSHDVKLIIAACGTVSSVAPHVLEGLPVPAIGVVEPAAVRAVSLTQNKKVGVIGTSATIHSGAFTKAITWLDAGVQVFAQACPLLVPLVESGWITRDDEVTAAAVRRYLAPLKDSGVDTLILGCTHFPLLSPLIANYLGDGVTLVDVGAEAAGACAELLARGGLCTGKQTAGDCRFFVTDKPQDFSRVAEMFLGRRVACDIQTVDIDSL